jgi:hypothetical protein
MSEGMGIEVDTLTIRSRSGCNAAAPAWPEVDHDAGGCGGTGTEPSRDDTLIKALVRAHRWRRRTESGQAKSITDLADQARVILRSRTFAGSSP